MPKHRRRTSYLNEIHCPIFRHRTPARGDATRTFCVLLPRLRLRTEDVITLLLFISKAGRQNDYISMPDSLKPARDFITALTTWRGDLRNRVELVQTGGKLVGVPFQTMGSQGFTL